MSNRDDQGGSPPADDRTLLDPLSSEELEALRRARERLRSQGGDPADPSPKPMVVGPDDDPTLGDAPTRATPALPSFDGRVSLDQIRPGAGREGRAVPDPAERGPAPSQPMSVYGNPPGDGDDPTLLPGSDPVAARATVPGRGGQRAPAHHEAPAPPAGSSGFGENTLMWMQPPKATPAPATVDVAPPPQANLGRRLRSAGLVALLLAVVVAVVATTMLGNETGTIELRTEPPGAVVTIDGKVQTNRTPVQVTMSAGRHRIELSREGYGAKTLDVNVDPDQPATKTVKLEPLSAAGLLTVTVQVQPVSARIALDDQVQEGTRTLMVPNVDPKRPHTIEVTAPQYKSVVREIPAGELKKSYTFVLERDPDATIE